jgi:hypothetical protein
VARSRSQDETLALTKNNTGRVPTCNTSCAILLLSRLSGIHPATGAGLSGVAEYLGNNWKEAERVMQQYEQAYPSLQRAREDAQVKAVTQVGLVNHILLQLCQYFAPGMHDFPLLAWRGGSHKVTSTSDHTDSAKWPGPCTSTELTGMHSEVWAEQPGSTHVSTEDDHLLNHLHPNKQSVGAEMQTTCMCPPPAAAAAPHMHSCRATW